MSECYFENTQMCAQNDGNPCSSEMKTKKGTTYHNVCDGCLAHHKSIDNVDDVRPLW